MTAELEPEIVSPESTSLTGCPSPTKELTVSLLSGALAAFTWKFYDRNGTLVEPTVEDGYVEGDDLTDAPVRAAIFQDVFHLSEAVHTGKITYTAEDGLIVLPPEAMRACPSIYQFEFYWKQPDNGLQLRSRGLVCVEESVLRRANVGGGIYLGPLSLSDIRTALRDYIEDNDSLGRRYEYSSKEILDAIMRPIAFWNETPPYVSRMSAVGFPHRERWLQATISLLKMTSAEWMMRNQVPLQAEGVTVDDRNKWQAMFNLAQNGWQEYVQFVHAAKRMENLRYGFRSI